VSVPPGDDPLAALAGLPGVAAVVDAAREACTTLRWHPALRRQTAAARAESVVRAARASAALDGADLPLEQVRGLVAAQRIADDRHQDPVDQVVLGALRTTAAAAELGSMISTAPAQALARLHLAAAAPNEPEQDVGRPRRAGVPPRELVDLGPAPSGAELSARLDALSRLVVGAGSAPALVLAAVVHGELLTLRPFPSGNGLVARAVSRAIVVNGGLDPTGVAVPEVGLLARGAAQYIGAAAAYGSGTGEGMAAWLRFWADAVVVGAREGTLVADAVLAGKLPA
jgi:Fic family protein